LPLFRYRNGDELSGATCRSDGHVMRFNAIEGRVNDVLDMPSGASVHSVALFHCIHQEPVHSIQLVIRGQERRFRLAAAELPADVEKRIRARLNDLHPDLADYPIDLVDDVATNRAGKRRWIVYE
jgi:phenylacetate-coenzyme A ligase PaaK-like adenylate-forming protein